MESNLVRKGWLWREIKVPGMKENIIYSGRGIGTEKCGIAGIQIISTSCVWFVPEFRFNHEGVDFTVQVRVWPWLAFRSMVVYKNEMLIYSEGIEPYKVTILTEILNVTFCLVLLLSLLLSAFVLAILV